MSAFRPFTSKPRSTVISAAALFVTGDWVCFRPRTYPGGGPHHSKVFGNWFAYFAIPSNFGLALWRDDRMDSIDWALAPAKVDIGTVLPLGRCATGDGCFEGYWTRFWGKHLAQIRCLWRQRTYGFWTPDTIGRLLLGAQTFQALGWQSLDRLSEQYLENLCSIRVFLHCYIWPLLYLSNLRHRKMHQHRCGHVHTVCLLFFWARLHECSHVSL